MKLIRNEERISLENFTKNVKNTNKMRSSLCNDYHVENIQMYTKQIVHCVCTSDFTVFLIKRKNSSLPA